ncbi:MAG: hypothetical protein AB1540_00410 [Bdellovibrionota bacterium]
MFFSPKVLLIAGLCVFALAGGASADDDPAPAAPKTRPKMRSVSGAQASWLIQKHLKKGYYEGTHEGQSCSVNIDRYGRNLYAEVDSDDTGEKGVVINLRSKRAAKARLEKNSVLIITETLQPNGKKKIIEFIRITKLKDAEFLVKGGINSASDEKYLVSTCKVRPE